MKKNIVATIIVSNMYSANLAGKEKTLDNNYI